MPPIRPANSLGFPIGNAEFDTPRSTCAGWRVPYVYPLPPDRIVVMPVFHTPMRTPWLKRDQWSRFCEVFAGEDKLPPSYEVWLEDSQRAAVDMTMAGFAVRRVEIDVEDLVAWCAAEDRIVDPVAMMLFASAVDTEDPQEDDHRTEGGKPGRQASPGARPESRRRMPGPSGKRVRKRVNINGPNSQWTIHVMDDVH
jgi:hypothetical protein